MKKLFFLFAFVLFIGCAEENQTPPKDIDQAAERAKDGVDKIADKLRNILDNSDGEMDKFKEIIDKIADKSKDVKQVVDNNKGKWKEEVDRITNDPKFKEKIEGLKSEGGDILKELEGLVKEISEDLKDIDEKN